jgi:glucosamine--fructose-6-phosphate aminotransferase (isomerizing)
MTKFLEDILKQPEGLIGSLHYLLGEGRASLDRAAFILNQANHIYLTGIGASWHAAMAGASFFHRAGHPVGLIEASELLHFSNLAPGSAIIIISRSGRSIEIVNLLDKARRHDANIVAITNAPDSPLALESDASICVDLAFDHAVSVMMYTALAMAAGLVATATIGATAGASRGRPDSFLGPSLIESLLSVQQNIGIWREKIEASDWIKSGHPVYFLARGASLASCHGARLLWEEAAKVPATAMTMGGFRHGPQEMITRDIRFCIWLDQNILRAEDLAVADDLRSLGAKVMLIGEELSDAAGDLVCSLPVSPRGWQFLSDIIPAQLAAERLSRLRGVDCDTLRYCSYIVENEGGILRDDKESQLAGTAPVSKGRNHD